MLHGVHGLVNEACEATAPRTNEREGAPWDGDRTNALPDSSKNFKPYFFLCFIRVFFLWFSPLASDLVCLNEGRHFGGSGRPNSKIKKGSPVCG